MKRIMIALLWLLAPMAVADTVWLDSKMRPVEEAEASYVLGEIRASDDGYWMRVNYLSGKVRYETFLDQADLSQASPVGDYRLYYESGQLLQEGSRDHQGRFQGVVISYHENGQVHREIPYQDDLVHGDYLIYWDDGQLRRKQQIQHQKRHGKSLSYHPNGELRFESNYVEGKQEGIEQSWSEDGILLRRAHYKNGKADGTSETFYDDGQIKSRQEFKNRQRVGEQQTWYQNGQLQRYQLFDEESKELIVRTFRKDGSQERNKEPIQSDFGPATVDERYNAAGQLSRRTTASDDKIWYRSERYNDAGELTEWHQTRNRRRHGRSYNLHWDGGYTEAYYYDGNYHNDFKKVDGDGVVMASGAYNHGQKVGAWYQNTSLTQFHEFYDEQGRLHGERKQLDADGQLVLHEHYRHGVLHGEVLGYQDGTLVTKGEFVDGKRHGVWKVKESYTAGSFLEGTYVAGVQVGEWRRYSQHGYLIGILRYDQAGLQHGREFIFEENGALRTVTDYKHAVRHGEEWLYLNGNPLLLRKYHDGELLEELAVEDTKGFWEDG